MEGAYYIGGHRRCKKRSIRPLRALLILLILLLAFAIWVHAALLPQVKALCETGVSNRLEALANQKAYMILSEGGYSYTDFVKLSYGTDGSVRSASVDTVRLNLVKTSLALGVLEALTTNDITVAIPMGNLLGILFFSGMGEDVRIEARVAEGMHARFHTVFTTTGINQTRHAIGFSLDFTATYLLPTGTERLAFSITVPIGETLIVG